MWLEKGPRGSGNFLGMPSLFCLLEISPAQHEAGMRLGSAHGLDGDRDHPRPLESPTHPQEGLEEQILLRTDFHRKGKTLQGGKFIPKKVPPNPGKCPRTLHTHFPSSTSFSSPNPPDINSMKRVVVALWKNTRSQGHPELPEGAERIPEERERRELWRSEGIITGATQALCLDPGRARNNKTSPQARRCSLSEQSFYDI